jgi:hypothetical protein
MVSPMQTFGDVLVVQDGTMRLSWQPLGGGLQAPVALWPNPVQRHRLDQHRERRAPLMVVLAAAEPPVYLLPEEARNVPASMHRLIETGEHVSEVRVPLLDWLPVSVAQRGRSFLEACLDWTRMRPELLVPPLILEDAPGVGESDVDGLGPVRFACRTAAHSFPLGAWRDLAERLFGVAAVEAGGEAGGTRVRKVPALCTGPDHGNRAPVYAASGS